MRLRSALLAATLALLCSPWPASAQPFTTRDLTSATCPGTGCAVLQVDGQGSVGVQVTGTFVGTLTFEQSIDGTNYVTLSAVPNTLGATVTTTTAVGFWSAPIAGARWIRIRFSAYTSGTATVSTVTTSAKLNTNGSAGSVGVFSTVRAADGTAVAPAYSFTSQTGTGLFYLATNAIGIAGGGNQRWLLDATNNALAMQSGTTLAWTSTASAPNGVTDTAIGRGGAAGKVVLTGTTPCFQLGGTTSAFPCLQRNGNAVLVNLADGSGATQIQAASYSLSGGSGTTLAYATAPTISSGFGTSPSIASNNGTAAFTVNVGTGGVATSGVIGLPAATTGWNVNCTDITTNSATVFITKQTASTTTTATIGNFNTSAAAAAWVASDILRCVAMAY